MPLATTRYMVDSGLGCLHMRSSVLQSLERMQVRFFERVKLERRIKQLQRDPADLSAIEAQEKLQQLRADLQVLPCFSKSVLLIQSVAQLYARSFWCSMCSTFPKDTSTFPS